MTGWGDNTVRLASISTQGSTANITIQSPENTILFVRPYPHLGGQFGGFTRHVVLLRERIRVPRPARRVVPRRDRAGPLLQASHRRGHEHGHGRRADGGDDRRRQRDQHVGPSRVPVVSGTDLRAFDVHAPEPVWFSRRPGRSVQLDGDRGQQADRGAPRRRRGGHERQPPPLRGEHVHADGGDRARFHLGHARRRHPRQRLHGHRGKRVSRSRNSPQATRPSTTSPTIRPTRTRYAIAIRSRTTTSTT